MRQSFRFGLALGIVAAVTPPAAAAQSAQLVLLGTGTPNPDPDRFGPAVAIIAGGRAYIVDAGSGVGRQAARAARAHQLDALKAERLGIAFITHLHSEHTVGLPDLIHTSWDAERAEPFRLFGPPGIGAMAAHLTKAWREDIRIRTEGTQPSTPNGWRIEATTVRPGVVYRDSNVVVRAIPVPHTTWRFAFGYRFEAGNRVFVVSGDTRPSDSLVAACNGCDVLLHEVYSAARLKVRPPE